MEKKVVDFCSRLSVKNAPAFLLVGQDYLRLGTDKDVLLDTILAKYGGPQASVELGYRSIFSAAREGDKEAVRVWISERANRLVTPAWLETVAGYAWSGVYSSSFDGLLNRAFRNEWRNVQPVLSPHLQPLDPRNRTRLHISYLFGLVERDDAEQKPPLDDFELVTAAPRAIALLARLPEQLTPLGTLAIEGYRAESDWLTSEHLFPILTALGKGQAFLFSTDERAITSPFLRRAVDQGKLTIFGQSLASVLQAGANSGILQLGRRPEEIRHGRRISKASDQVAVPDNIWTLVSRFGTILDDSGLAPPPELSAEKRYSAFRAFLAESSTQPIWSAYPAKFPFERDYETVLQTRIDSALRRTTFDTEPLILHGQTGAGKTIALGSIAYRVRSARQVPVVFIARRSQRLNHADLDVFCQWAEDAGFSATLVIWDGMQDVEQYYLLHKYLLGRGRKFVLAGSSYRLDEKDHPTENLIYAPAELSASEIPRFKKHLSSFEPSLGDRLERYLSQGDNSFLVALYRLLPETRSQVRQGLHLEAGAAEVALRQKAQQIKPEAISGSILAAALIKAGVLEGRDLILPTAQTEVAGERLSAEQELVGLVMVPGRFGLQIPVEVLLRAVSKTTIANFHEIFSGIDLFRWSEDSLNNILIGARHPLEAKLIAQSRLGGPRSEFEYARKLLTNVRPSDGSSETAELNFAADFVRSLGPNGPEQKLYIAHYLDLANILTSIREQNGVQTPRLMLQEASLLREAVTLNIFPEEQSENRIELLGRAEQVLASAIGLLGDHPRVARLKSMLLVELASTFGTRARELLRADAEMPEVLVQFTKARDAAMRARTLQPEDFFPIDVIAWSTKDLLSHGDLDERTRYDVIVNLFNILALCEGDEITSRDREKLERRRLEFGVLLGDDNLRDDALQKLTAIGSTAGHYLTAVHKAGELPAAEGPITAEMRSRYTEAASYLRSKYDAIKDDGRCLYLLLRYWWTASSGLPFYPPERTVVPFGDHQWKEALDVLETLIAVNEEYLNPSLLYLQAISKWHLGYYDDAYLIWRDLQRISDRVTGRRRVLKTYLASSPSGEPIRYHGTVSELSPDGTKGTVFVEGLRQRVAFFPRDFRMEDLRRDDELGPFHIAFNYIAPTADPIHHFKQGTKS